MDGTVILVQLILNGLMIGAVYSLVAIGLTLIYGVMKIINFAHGAFFMMSMYIAFWLYTLFNINPLLSTIITFLLFTGIGYATEVSLIKPVLKAHTSSQVLMTIGLMLTLQTLAQVLWTSDYRKIYLSYGSDTIKFGSLMLPITKLIIFVISLALCLGFYIFLKRTYIGTAIRAVAQDSDTAQILGIDSEKIFAITFGMGLGLAAVAGCLVSTFFYIYPYVGDSFILVAFVVVVLGGLGNYMGTLAGGFIVGVVESIAGYYLLSSLKFVVLLLIFLFILLLRPEGLFERRVRRAS